MKKLLKTAMIGSVVFASALAQAQYTSSYPTYGGGYYQPTPTYDVGYGRAAIPQSYSYAPYDYVPTPFYGPVYDNTSYTAPVIAPIAQQIQALLNSSVSIEIGDTAIDTNQAKKLYKLRAFQPGFVTTYGTNSQAQALVDFLRNKTIGKGLSPADYVTADIEKRLYMTDARSLAELDILLTNSMISVASHLMNGRANPKNVDTHVNVTVRSFTEHAALNGLLRPYADISSGLESLEPQHPEYKKLVKALQELQAIKSQQGGWPTMKSGVILKPGVSNADVPVFRQRMVELGHLPDYERYNTNTMYDNQLFIAAQAFQNNHKLQADGKIGPRGVAVLNIPIETRIEQLRATIEKWRWLPRQLGDRYITINLAQQELRLSEYGRPMLAMRTVNGKLLRPTPIMVDSLTQVTLNPYWFPPDSIIRNDIIPHAQKDPNYMISHKIKLFGPGGVEVNPLTVPWKSYKNTIPPYQFREEPGTTNSLGRVKFSLAKSDSTAIYMHDTNMPELFPNIERLNSSGCIRLEKPLDLLQYLFREVPSYDVNSVNTILAQPNLYPARKVDLPRAIPVYIMYQTVSFDDNGALRFTRDYYGQDERIVRAMEPLDGTL